jgi:hypothetical protein
MKIEANSGLSACLYFTQDDAELSLSLDSADKPKDAQPGDMVKRLGRVALCCFVNGGRNLVLLDYAISDRGHVASGPGLIELTTKSIEDCYDDEDDRSPATVLDLDFVHIDGSGLTVHGIVIDMLKPIVGGVELVESAAGKVMIYFGIGDGQLSCLHYDTCLSYKPNTLELVGGGKIVIFPKIDSITTLSLKITASALLPIYALDLVVTGTFSSGKAIEETWLNLPRSAQDFMMALGGLPENQRKGQPYPTLGKGTAVAPSDASIKTWSIILTTALLIPLRPGTCILVGSDHRFQILKEAGVGSSSLGNCHLMSDPYTGDVTNTAPQDVTVLGYDFTHLASSVICHNAELETTTYHANFSKGSQLLGFRGISTSALVTPMSKDFPIKGMQRRLTSRRGHQPPSLRDGCATCFVDPNNITAGGHAFTVEMWFRHKGLPAYEFVPSHMLDNEPLEKFLLYYYDQEVLAAPQLEAPVEQSCIIGLKPDVPEELPEYYKFMMSNQAHLSQKARFNGQHGFTIEFWAICDGDDGSLSCKFSAETPPQAPGFNISVGPRVGIELGGMAQESTAKLQIDKPDTHQWHHYAFIYDPNEGLSILLDGVLRGKQFLYGWLLGGCIFSNLELGNRSGSWRPCIIEFRVWATVRTVDDIQKCMNYRLPMDVPGLEINLRPRSTIYDFVPPLEWGKETKESPPNPPLLHDLHLPGAQTLFAIVNGIWFALPQKISARDDSWHHLAITQTRTPAVILTGNQYLKVANPTAALNLSDFTVAMSLTIKSETRPSSTIFKRSDGSTCAFELRRLKGGRIQFFFTARSEAHEVTFNYLELGRPYHVFFSRKSTARPKDQLIDHIHTLVLLPSTSSLNGATLESRSITNVQSITTAAPVDSAAGSLTIGVNEGDAYTDMEFAWIRFYNDAIPYTTIIAKPEDNLSAAWGISSTTDAEVREAKSGDMVAVIGPDGPKFTLSTHSDDCSFEVLYDASTVADKDLKSFTPTNTLHWWPCKGQGSIHRQLTLGSGCPDPANRLASRGPGDTSGWLPVFNGDAYVDEVRLWPFARTKSQILDEMYGRIQDSQAQMIAYFQADAQKDDVWNDSSAGAHRLIFERETPQDREWTSPIILPLEAMSNTPACSPVGDTPPVIQDYLAKQSQPGLFVRKTLTSSKPALCEYGSVEISKSFKGSWNLLTGWIEKDTGRLVLRTSFRVGTLVTDFIGNMSVGNSLQGYIEGAPPIPGDNYIDA